MAKYSAIERRNLLTDKDTIYLSMSNMNKLTYTFRFVPKEFSPSFDAYLQDRYLNTLTPISTVDTTYISFTIATDVASGAADRFKVVFSPSKKANVKVNVAASKNSAGVAIDWQVENETGGSLYAIEKSI